jgi:large subunit ribosomal protein L7A
MLSKLKDAPIVVGIKQTHNAVRSGQAVRVYAAKDAEMRVLRPVLELCDQMAVPVTRVDTMRELGRAASIEVGASVVAVLKQ